MASSALEPPCARVPTQTVLYVLTDPWMFSLITSCQGGVPVALYELWIEHDPPLGRIARANRPVTQLVARFGTPHHLDLLQKGRVHRGGDCRGPKLDRLPRWAVEHRRPDLLQWAISSNVNLGDPHLLWQETVTNWKSDADLALLELLQSRSPLTTGKAQHILKRAFPATPTVALFRLRPRGAYEGGYFDVLEYLVVNFARHMRQDVAKVLVVASEPSVLQIVDRHMGVFESAFQEAVIDALQSGDSSKAQQLRARCPFPGHFVSIDVADRPEVPRFSFH